MLQLDEKSNQITLNNIDDMLVRYKDNSTAKNLSSYPQQESETH
jgi:hypothetical protein